MKTIKSIFMVSFLMKFHVNDAYSSTVRVCKLIRKLNELFKVSCQKENMKFIEYEELIISEY